MDWNVNVDLKSLRLERVRDLLGPERLGSLRVFQPRVPPLAVELASGRLHLAAVERQRKQPLALRRYRSVETPPGALDLHPGRPPGLRPAEVGAALLRVLEEEGLEGEGISVVLPDHLARVALLHLGERPVRRQEAVELIRWKLRKTVPFRVEDAHVDYQMFTDAGDGGALICLATLLQRSVLDPLERMFRDLDRHPGLVDLSTFSLVNLYRGTLHQGDGLVSILNVTGSFFALILLERGVPRFYRAKSFAFVDDPSRDARRRMVIREVGSSLSYVRERLAAGGLGRLYLRCVDLDLSALAQGLAETHHLESEPVDPSRILAVEPRSSDPTEHQRAMQRIAPALGAALGEEG